MFKPTDKKNYLVSGMFISALLLVVMITVFMLNKENPFFSSKVKIVTEVKSAQSLKEGAAVQLRGIKVGSVQSIEFKNLSTLRINLGITEKYKEWIKKDSEITFKTQGVLGDKYLEIGGGTEESPAITDGDILITNENSQLDHIMTKGEDLVVAAGGVLNKLDNIMGNVEGKRIDKILTNLENLTANSNKIMVTLNDKNFAQSITNLKSSSDSLTKVTKRIEEGPGTMHALIFDQGLHEDLRALFGGANRSKVLKYFIRESIKKEDSK
ncbi:MAG: MCE family protein [Rhizobacter sp.]|nr:MCE family protein [Bacteriovorax sp.]